MSRVFVDSGAFFALLVAQDRSHRAARATFQALDNERRGLVTTNFVLVETYALLLSRTREGRQAAIRFLDAVDDSAMQVERVSAADEQKAIEFVRAHADKSYSLCDAASFVVMERLGCKEAIADDRHFREYGRFQLL